MLLATPGGPASWTGVLWTLMGIGFHAGVFAIQGLDFISFWGTIFFVYLVGLQSGGGVEGLSPLEAAGYHAQSATIYDIMNVSAVQTIVFGAGAEGEEDPMLQPGQPLFLLALISST